MTYRILVICNATLYIYNRKLNNQSFVSCISSSYILHGNHVYVPKRGGDKNICNLRVIKGPNASDKVCMSGQPVWCNDEE